MVNEMKVGLPRVDAAYKNSFIITNLKNSNPIDKKDFGHFAIDNEGLKYTTIEHQKGLVVSRSFSSTKRIKDKGTINKVLDFFKNQEFKLINISECQRVTKEKFETSKKTFVEQLEKLAKPSKARQIKKGLKAIA